MAQTAIVRLAKAIKSIVNNSYSPTWCVKCGTRLDEQEIGFREQGSRYTCRNAKCPACGLPFAITRPPSTIINPN